MTSKTLLIVAALGLTVTGALAVYVVTSTPSRDEASQARELPGAPTLIDRSEPEDVPEAIGTAVLLYEPVLSDGLATYVTTEGTAPAGDDPMVFAVNDYLRHVVALPEGAALQAVSVEDGLATLEFNEAFATSYGTEDEALVVNGVRATLGQFPEIDEVLFTVLGEPMESTGNVDLSQPRRVIRDDPSFVRPKPD